MDSSMRTIYPTPDLTKGLLSNVLEGYPDWETPEEGWRTQQPKCCGGNSEDEDVSLIVTNFSTCSFILISPLILSHPFYSIPSPFIPLRPKCCSNNSEDEDVSSIVTNEFSTRLFLFRPIFFILNLRVHIY